MVHAESKEAGEQESVERMTRRKRITVFLHPMIEHFRVNIAEILRIGLDKARKEQAPFLFLHAVQGIEVHFFAGGLGQVSMAGAGHAQRFFCEVLVDEGEGAEQYPEDQDRFKKDLQAFHALVSYHKENSGDDHDGGSSRHPGRLGKPESDAAPFTVFGAGRESERRKPGQAKEEDVKYKRS